MTDSRARTAAYAKSPGYEQIVERLNQAIARDPLPAALPRRRMLFIVGPPRSGTTLLHQALAASGAVGYVSNLIARFFARPAVGADVQALLAPLLPSSPLDFGSRAGATDGWAGPHEFGYFWQRFFPFTEHHQPADAELRSVDRIGLASELALLEERLARPLVLKNPLLGFVLPFLADALPTAHFVAIERKPLAVAASLLRMRREYHGSENEWFSVRPRAAVHAASFTPAQQIALQLHALQEAQTTAEVSIGRERWRGLDYERLCRDPRGTVTELTDWLGVSANPQALASIPERFAATTPELPPEQAAVLRDALVEAGLI